MGLGYVVEEEAAVAAVIVARRGGEAAHTLGDHIFRYGQFQLPGGHIEDDFIAGLDGGERTAYGRFRRDMQHDGAVGDTAHARIGDADHVGDAFGEQFAGHGNVPGFRHAGGAFGSAVAHDQDRGVVHGEIVAVDLGGHLPGVLENI